MGICNFISFSDYKAPLVARLRRAARKLWRNTCDYGAIHAAGKVLAALAHPIYYRRTYRLYRADLAQISVAGSDSSNLVIRLLQEGEDDLRAQSLMLSEWLDERIESILENGGKCLVVLDQRKVVGFNLISFHSIHLPVVHFMRPLRSGEAFSEQVTVSRQYRGRGIGESLRKEAFRLLQAQGIHRFYGGTDERNIGNRALCRKVGLKEIAEISYLKILWMRKSRVRRLPR